MVYGFINWVLERALYFYEDGNEVDVSSLKHASSHRGLQALGPRVITPLFIT
jgi:hypothetical protein